MTPATAMLAGIEVGRVGLGTNRLQDTDEGVAFVEQAVAAGVSHIDTAHVYTGGESEAAIGRALSPPPDGCVVATKGGIGGEGRGRPDVLREQIEESLRRLRLDTIPLYYLHRVDPETPFEESLGAIREAVDAGKVRHVGISEVTVEQVERAREVVPIAAVQNAYSLSERKHDPVLDHCADVGIPFVAFYPLKGDGGDALEEIAERRGATPAQVTLAWMLRRSPAMLPIPGTRSIEHVRENLAAAEIELTDEEFEALANGARPRDRG